LVLAELGFLTASRPSSEQNPPITARANLGSLNSNVRKPVLASMQPQKRKAPQMKTRCCSCRKPWDVEDLLQKLSQVMNYGKEYDTETKSTEPLSITMKLNTDHRTKLQAANWQFGRGIINVTHCPDCPAGVKPDPICFALKEQLLQFHGDDANTIMEIIDNFAY
jgi:hypothetical protein